MIDYLTEQVMARITAVDAMIPIGVDQLTEILVSLHQCLHVFCRILIVHIIISQTMTDQQGTMQL
jgi:hypothetical protein